MSKLRVLIVEDDEEYIQMLEKLLEKAGYDTFHADHLKDALGLYYSVQPDLVLLDIFLKSFRMVADHLILAPIF